ncbi:unnamed protein product [Rotaria sordida]|uniref:Beta-galactosidase n=1 Tax=Rotaria sordida TaxID=392033 RepID=A0A813U2C2_9BILA|nr:unnamed protein product [Rotaria sordida]
MQDIEQDSYSYHRLHEKIALVSLLMKEMRDEQQQQQQHPQSFFLSSTKKRLGTFSCDSLSCVSSNVQTKMKHRDVNNNKNNNNNNNNISTSMADEQNHVLEFYVFNISHERNLNLIIDSNDKRLIIFYNISNGLYAIGVRNVLFGFLIFAYLIIKQMSSKQYEPTLILDNERHLFIRLFKTNDLNREKIRPFRILSGSLHYFRVLPQLWSDRIEKMKKAGLNTIETYIPWNFHEPEMGIFKFNEGLTDLVSFLKLVHQHEMFTIIRPSGYICAEWEWGGLPSWLLEDDQMRVRTTHPNFIKALKNYYSVLLPILSEHQYNRHEQGSIIAFQIENEYGSYGNDKDYLEAIRSMYIEYGLNELFFTSDGRNDFSKGSLDDVWATVNCQRQIKKNVEKLLEFRPNQHIMITEYWTGWFDYWGGKHQTGQQNAYTPKEFEKDLEEILLNSKYEISINFYMFFGGTNFGFTSGGHHFPSEKYAPLVTSYDYNAPLNESGDPTEKYFVIQNIIKKFYEQNSQLIIYNHERIIDDTFEIIQPKISKKISYGKINIFGYKTFEQILNDDILTNKYHIQNGPLNMEQIQINNKTISASQGFIVYTNNNIQNLLKQNEKHYIVITAIADNAIVLANGNVIHKSLHTDNSFRFNIPSDTSYLTIIVENMGRINYGPTLDRSRKGILDKVLFDNKIELKEWTIHVLEFRQGMSSITDWNKLIIDNKDSNTIYDLKNGPQLFYAPFEIANENFIQDTYLTFNGQWSKGVAFVNGFNIGRYWSIGPQLTLYIPKELLFKGDILVFLNDKNIFKSPITLTNDHIKSEFLTLRRHKKSISIGICRCTERSLLNNTTIQHLSSLTLDEFKKLSLEHSSTPSPNESRKSLTITDEIITNTDLKTISNKHKLIHEQHYKPLVYKRNTSPNRDSGFIETDGTNTSMLTDRSVISNVNNNNKRRSKISLEKSEDGSMDTHKSLDSLQQSISKITTTTTEPTKKKPSSLIYSTQKRDKHVRTQDNVPIQTVTDACFIYRRQVVKQDTNDDEKAAIITRGREIAYEAANTPTIPSSMPNYTRDQIRELYGELDKKTRRLQDDEYIYHSSNGKHQWKLASPTNMKKITECPLPKFRLDKTPEHNDETLLMAAYLSTGITNPRIKPIVPIDNFHSVMMNASAKVNEWAHNNEIYLTPINKNIIHTSNNDHSTMNSSPPLVFDVHFNINQLAARTPTDNNNSNRPTFLEVIEQQQTTDHSNQTNHNQENRRSIRRQPDTTDTISSSPDSNDIALETTPSTPGSCGMYLEPYMRRGYDLPSVDHDIRDSSWQHTDNEDIDESIRSMKNITPIESPTTSKLDTNITPIESPTTSKLDTNILSSQPMTSQINDMDSLIDLEDGTTVSYHTAKESRLDNTNQSTLSVESDETVSSTHHQPSVRDELINNTMSPEESFYYDACTSPTQTNQQTLPSTDKQDILIDNLTNLLEQIETFNYRKQQLLPTVDEEKSRLSPEGEESTTNIDCLVTIVDDIHEYNQRKTTNTMDSLLFIYDDDINDEQANSSIDNLVEIVHSAHETTVCVNNLLFIYDDAITPTDDEPKQIINDSDEWSYDNLIIDQNEQNNIDNLGLIIHDALTVRFQKPIKSQQISEVEELTTNIDNLTPVVHEILTTKIEKPIDEISHEIEEPIFDIDNLTTIVHEALAAQSQKPIKTKTTDQFNSDVQEIIDESMTDIHNLGTIIHDALSTRFQKPIKIKTTDQFNSDVHEIIDEPMTDIDNLTIIVHDALSTRFQKPIKIQTPIEIDHTFQTEIFPEFIDESISENLEKTTNEFDQESNPSVNELIDDNIHTSETIIYEIEPSNEQLNPTILESQSLPVSNLSQIISGTLLTSSHYHQDKNKIECNIKHQSLYDEEIYEEYGYRRTTTDSNTDDIVEKYEELCRRYLSSCDQYQTTAKKLDDEINQFEKGLHEQKQNILTPTSDTTTSEELITTIERVIDMRDQTTVKRNDTDDYCLTLNVQRQPNYIGKYGFDFEEIYDGKIQVSKILDEIYCPNINIGDEIISINNDRTFKTYEQCQKLFDSLWKNDYETIQITVIKSANNIPITKTSEPVSLQSSSLSWPLSTAESGRIIEYIFFAIQFFIDFWALDIA